MFPPSHEKHGTVPTPDKSLPQDYKGNTQPFLPAPVNKGEDSTSGESELEAAMDGTAPDMGSTSKP